MHKKNLIRDYDDESIYQTPKSEDKNEDENEKTA